LHVGEGSRGSILVGDDGKAVALARERSDVRLIENEVLKLRSVEGSLEAKDGRVDYQRGEFRIGRSYLAATRIGAQERQATRIERIPTFVLNRERI
jgi:hypothetical protein